MWHVRAFDPADVAVLSVYFGFSETLEIVCCAEEINVYGLFQFQSRNQESSYFNYFNATRRGNARRVSISYSRIFLFQRWEVGAYQPPQHVSISYSRIFLFQHVDSRMPVLFVSGFNLVLENLLISTRTEDRTPMHLVFFCFNLVLENLLISTDTDSNIRRWT